MNEQEEEQNELVEVRREGFPSELPIMAIRSTVIFPYAVVPLSVARPRSIRLVDEVAGGDKLFGALAQRETQVEDPGPEGLHQVGTICKIVRMLKQPDGVVMLLVQGLARFRALSFIQEEPFFLARIELLESILELDKELEALVQQVSQSFQRIVQLSPQLQSYLQLAAINISDPGQLADFVAANVELPFLTRQQILETLKVKERLRLVLRLLEERIEILELGSKIQTEVKSEIDKTMRERYLREQLAAIRRELGEDERPEIKELAEKIKAAKLPPEVEEEAKRELERLSEIHPSSAEYTVARTYLEWIVSLPWSVSTEDNLDIARAKQVLDEDHYDLEKVKGRILEYLAVLKLRGEMRGPILCFVGPPGVGKTSLGQSIARALGRKFVRISLGGVGDEAEIRGHRRTYIGALPGRIIQGIRRAGSNNPVFMMDEVDKLGRDFRGDPAAALLEVLDPEQNHKFMDHYLDQPFDLSKVMFITTANILDTIPPALLDRMEVLELPGYSEEEKLQIAKRYLIPKQLKEHGLKEEQLQLTEGVLKRLIREYTREAGVRNLEREIANLCRKVAAKIAAGEMERVELSEEDVPKLLGPAKFFPEAAERTEKSGVAIGLVWTPVGGDIVFIEATKMAGKGNLILTGKLGEVMKESAQAALSYIRSKAEELGIEARVFLENDIHIHVPSGAIPKDGPSAGVTIATALASLLTDTPVRSDLAMTGEITLRGRVLPVGGIREKVLAAHRVGLKRVILPKRNEVDLEEIPENVKKDLQFEFVESVDEVLQLALPQRLGVS
ncbi:MAG: endopeptidase La [Candidatus Bipolaricaulia bacterium]